MSEAIRDWLAEIGLDQYAEEFEAQAIEPGLLPDLDHDTLKQLGVAVLGHRLKILRAAASEADIAADPGGSSPLSAASGDAATSAWTAERRQLTILFCDMVGSTKISTQLDLEDFRDLIRSFHEAVSDVATRASGHVAQFMGDGALVYFGYPHALEDAAERAVNMGLALIDAVSRLETVPGAALEVRVGIATGMVVVGDLVGRGLSEDAVVSGETPNLAARLQTVAEPGTVVIGEETHRLLGRSFTTEKLPPQSIKGFSTAINAWRVIGEGQSGGRFEARRAPRLTPLVGRKAELRQMLDVWNAAKGGHGSLFMLSGEAGLGKSRLMREVELRTRSPETRLIQFQASPYFANTALYPVRRALEVAAGFDRKDTPEQQLDKVLAVFRMQDDPPGEEGALIAGLMGLPQDRFPPLTISIGLQRQRLFETMIDRIKASSERRPYMMIFEDLHWADPTTIEFLGLLVAAAPDARLMLVGTFRPEFTPPWEEGDAVHLCQIHRLGKNEVRGIIGFLARDSNLSDTVLDTLAERTDGIPFFVEELTKSVVELKHLYADGQGSAMVPSSLRDTLMARLDALPAPREIAQMAAAIGREFEEDLLLEISRKSPQNLKQALNHLAGADLIFASQRPGSWVFRHALIRDAAYESLLRRDRQELHLRIARAMEELFPERVVQSPEILARHCSEARDHANAARYWLTAAQTARQRGAIHEAIAHVRAGLEQAEQMPDSPRRDTLLLQLHITDGFVLFAAVGYGSPKVEAAFARASKHGMHVSDPDILTPLHNGYGAHLTMRGDISAGHEELERMVTISKDNPRLQIYAAAAQTWSLFNRGEFEKSVSWGKKLERLYEDGHWDSVGPRHTTGDPKVIAGCFHAASLWALGHPDQAAAKASETAEYADSLNDPYSAIYAQVNGVCRVADLMGETDRVLDVSTRAIEYSKSLGYDFAAGYSLFWKARALADKGDRDTALAIVTASLAACQAASVRYHEPHFRAMQAQLLAASGDPEGAAAALEGLEDLVESSGERWQAADVRCARARVAEATGDDAAAEAAWRDALQSARALGTPAWELRASTGLAELLGRNGKSADGREILEPVLAAFSEGDGTADISAARQVLDGLG